jgi:hypothetical protein
MLQEKLFDIGLKHTQNVKDLIYRKEKLIEDARNYTQDIISFIQKTSLQEDLMQFLESNLHVEAIYVLDAQNGVQKGDTFIAKETNEFFTPAKDGDSHFIKEYFYITKESKRGSFLSQKYISRASGKMCRTYAQRFMHETKEYIVCIDLKEGHFS